MGIGCGWQATTNHGGSTTWVLGRLPMSLQWVSTSVADTFPIISPNCCLFFLPNPHYCSLLCPQNTSLHPDITMHNSPLNFDMPFSRTAQQGAMCLLEATLCFKFCIHVELMVLALIQIISWCMVPFLIHRYIEEPSNTAGRKYLAWQSAKEV